MPQHTKPPTGIEPRTYWLERRAKDLSAAIQRYLAAGLPIPPEWVAEHNEILKELTNGVANCILGSRS